MMSGSTKVLAAIAFAATAPMCAMAQPSAAGNPLGLPGAVNVNVMNTPANPVPVQSNETPYSVDAVGTCNNTNCFIDFPPVPAGKMLVIKHLSTFVRPTPAAIFDFAELVTSNTEVAGIGARFIFPLTRIGLAGSSVVADTYAVNAPVLAYVRAGSYARLTLASHVAGGAIFSQGSISGYLIPAPQ